MVRKFLFMAKQVGPIFLVGTFGGVHFYKMGDDYYVRMQSSLEAKTVKTSARFRNTMRFANMMAGSSTIGRAVFKALPARFKQSWMYRAFVGEAMQLFKTGKAYEEVFDVLWKLYAMEFMEGYDETKEFVHVKVMEEAILAGIVKKSKKPVIVPFDKKLYIPLHAYSYLGRRGAGRLSRRYKAGVRECAPAAG